MNPIAPTRLNKIRQYAGEFDPIPTYHEVGKPFSFTFRGLKGSVDEHDFLRLVNCGYHLESASDELRAIIEAARP